MLETRHLRQPYFHRRVLYHPKPDYLGKRTQVFHCSSLLLFLAQNVTLQVNHTRYQREDFLPLYGYSPNTCLIQ